MSQNEKRKPERIRLTADEIERIHKLKHDLSIHLDRRMTILMLAKEVGMNDYKLKIAFRQLFGMGLFEYHLGLRMNEARRLLEETNKPVKAIAKLTGYSRITSFITTFRKFFGYTPSSVRKRR